MTNDSDISDFVTPYHEEKSSSAELFYTSDKTIIEKVRIHGKWHLIKRIAKAYEFSPQHRSSLEREFEIGFRLEHPHIVRYIDKKYSENAVPYLILEYVDGSTLRDLMLKPQGLKGFGLTKCFKTIVETLVYLHKQQIYHLDIKPDNIIITHKEQNAKLIDFGFAESDSFGQPLGSSLHYKAPEFNGDSSVIDGRTDMYSFALTMKELCETVGISLPQQYKTVIAKSLNTDASKRIDAETALAIICKKPRFELWLLLLLPIIISLYFFGGYHNNSSEKVLVVKHIPSKSLIKIPKKTEQQTTKINTVEPKPQQRVRTTTENNVSFGNNVTLLTKPQTSLYHFPTEKEWRKSFDSAMKAAKEREPKLVTSVQDSARCVQLGKQLWDLYTEAKSKRTLTKRDKMHFRDNNFDSLYAIFLEYQKKWEQGTPEYIFYSDLWYRNIHISTDSINRDIYGK